MEKSTDNHVDLGKLDLQAWRVMEIKKRMQRERKNLAYNMRPRLRRDENEAVH